MTAAPHYVVPGPADGWLVIVRGASALLVRPGSASPEELYAALEGPDAVRTVIERLTSGGFAATPDFGLVAGSSTGPRHVVVRGPVEVRMPDGVVSGAEVSTWTERVVSAASAYRIVAPIGADSRVDGGEGSRESSALPLVDGAVWGTSIASGAESAVPAGAGASDPVEETVLAEEVRLAGQPEVTTPVTDATPATDATPVTEEAPAAESAPTAEDTGIAEETVLAEDTVLAEETVQPGALPAVAAPAPEGYDHLFEATIVRPVEAAAVRPAADDADASEPLAHDPAAHHPAPGQTDHALDGDHDGLTVMSGDVEGLAARARPADHEVARLDDTAGYVVVLPDGTREPLDGEMLLGRSPSGRVTGDRMPRLVTLTGDPDISRTHVRIALEGDTVVVTDMHSRNGTTLRIAGQSPQLLRAGEPAAVIPGSVVDLGGGTLLAIEQTSIEQTSIGQTAADGSAG